MGKFLEAKGAFEDERATECPGYANLLAQSWHLVWNASAKEGGNGKVHRVTESVQEDRNQCVQRASELRFGSLF